MAKSGWFSSIDIDKRERFARVARLMRYAAGDTLFRTGDEASGIIGIVSGAVMVAIPGDDGAEYRILRVDTGRWIGDLAPLMGSAPLTSAIAHEPTVAVQLPVSSVRRLVERDPMLWIEFNRLAHENTRILLRIIAILSVTQASRRIALRLLLQDDMTASAQGWLPIGQAELAEFSATSVPTVRRVLSRFGEAGIVELGYRRLRVLDRQQLLASATE